MTDHSCHVCRSVGVRPAAGFPTLRRVASDCRPWPAGGALGLCVACGTVQKLIDPSWWEEANAIYADYELNIQSRNRAEQAVYDQDSGTAIPRSQRILTAVRLAAGFPVAGRMIDVGCGNGATLRAFSALMPEWELNGIEPNSKDPGAVLGIPGVKQVFEGALADVPGTFDVVSMVHVLEHIENPASFLAQARQRLQPGGCLLIEVPYFPDNPYDLVIADHCTHFTVETLAHLLAVDWLEPIAISTDIVSKEITAIARRAMLPPTSLRPAMSPDRVDASWRAVEVALDWLKQVMSAARCVARQGNFGLFGTSISAMWLFGELQQQVKFFVEEDPNRIGTIYHGCPVLHPKDAPAGSHVFMILPRQLAERVLARLRPAGVEYHLPPPYQNHFKDVAVPLSARRVAAHGV